MTAFDHPAWSALLFLFAVGVVLNVLAVPLLAGATVAYYTASMWGWCVAPALWIAIAIWWSRP